MPPNVVLTRSLTDGRVVSPKYSQTMLPASANGADRQKPYPLERALLNDRFPLYGWANWLTAKWSVSHPHPPRRLFDHECSVVVLHEVCVTHRLTP